MYEEFLEKVSLLSTIDTYEKQQLADALKSKELSVGDYVIKQGEEGNDFFFVESGELNAMKVMKEGEEPI